MEQHQAPSGSDSDEDLASHAIPPQTLALQPAEESQTVGPDHSPHTLKAPAPPALTGSSRNPSGRGRRQLSREEDKDVDLYYKYRGEALKLSRRWHKKLHQSATAFAAGQHSGHLYNTLLCFMCLIVQLSRGHVQDGKCEGSKLQYDHPTSLPALQSFLFILSICMRPFADSL